MSAYKEFTSIKFANGALLVAALKELGLTPEIGTSLTLRDYGGRARPERAQIVVRRQQIGSASNDLGFAWNGKAFTPVISEYDDRNKLDAAWRQKLQAAYAKLAVLKFLQVKGATGLSATPLSDGSVAIRATVEVQL